MFVLEHVCISKCTYLMCLSYTHLVFEENCHVLCAAYVVIVSNDRSLIYGSQ